MLSRAEIASSFPVVAEMVEMVKMHGYSDRKRL